MADNGYRDPSYEQFRCFRDCPECGAPVYELHKQFGHCRACHLRLFPEMPDASEEGHPQYHLPVAEGLTRELILALEQEVEATLGVIAARHGVDRAIVISLAGDLGSPERRSGDVMPPSWTDAECRRFRAMWLAGEPVQGISQALHKSKAAISDARRRLGLAPRRKIARSPHR